MNRLILPAPLATLLVTRQPCDGPWCINGTRVVGQDAHGEPIPDGWCACMSMVARWVTQPDDWFYVGERVEFVADCDCPTHLALHRITCSGQSFVGSGVIAESLPILAEGQDPYTTGVPIPPSGYVPHIAMNRDRLLWWKGRSETENLSTGRPTWVTADISDQRHGQDWSAGRWAWRITEAVPA